jgi:hypothetical protein
MYLQYNMEPNIEPEFASIEMKIEDRLRHLAMKHIDAGSEHNTIELSRQLCNNDILSPTEFRAIRYFLEVYDKALHACRLDPNLIKEETEIGERVVRIIDNRLNMT